MNQSWPRSGKHRYFSFGICGLATTLVLLALVQVNTTGIVKENHSDDGWEFSVDRQHGWPTTYKILVGGRHRTSVGLNSFVDTDLPGTRVYFNTLSLGINLVVALVMLISTCWLCSQILDRFYKFQFSLRTILLATAIIAVLAFLLLDYQRAVDQNAWRGHVDGQPYLKWSGLFRWFGPRSPYDWLAHISWLIRAPILVAWICTVCAGCWCALRVAHRVSGRQGIAPPTNGSLLEP